MNEYASKGTTSGRNEVQLPVGGDSTEPEPVCLVFDGGRIEPSRNLVRLEGEAISLEPRTMEVLAYLATHSGHVVSKAELLGNVWEGRWVTEDALSVYIYELRKALGDDARNPRFVETVRKRGYRWMPPIRVEALPLAVHGVADVGDSEDGDVVESAADLQEPKGAGALKTVPVSRRALQGAGVALAAGIALAAVVLVSPAESGRPSNFVTAEMPELNELADERPGAVADEELALTELRRGNEYYRGRSPKDLLRAESAYLRATELDPTLAEAWGGLATTYAMMAEYPLRDRFELYHQARRGAEKSFELDSSEPTAHVAMGMIRLALDWNRDEASRQIALALELRPDLATAWEVRSWIETANTDYESAIASVLRAVELDPHSANLYALLAFIHGLADNRPEMLAALDRAAELDPGNYLVHWYGWVIHWIRGEYDEAVPFLLLAFETVGRYEWAEELEEIYRERGFDEFLDAYGSVIPDHGNLIERARIALYFDERDRALDLLEQAAANRDSELTWLATFPDLRKLKDEPRFRVLLDRVGGNA